MSFSDSDWTSEAAAPTPGRRDAAWGWALLLGIAIGAAGATLVFFALERLSPRDAIQTLASTRPATHVEAPPLAKAPPTLIETAPPAAGPSEPPPAAAASTAVEPSQAVIPAASPPARQPNADEQRRKERAWAAYYKRPASCDGNPTTDQLIECANHFIRSKREFDERWKAGNH